MFDAHAHLQDERFSKNLSQVISKAEAAGVLGIVCCGTQETDWPKVQQIYRDYPGYVLPSYGLHPWYIKKRSKDWLGVLRSYIVLTHNVDRCRGGSRTARTLPGVRTMPGQRLPAVGEIGLDFAIDDFDEKDQRAVFEAQLDLAKELARPVSIHCRRAWGALAEILHRAGPLSAGGLVHSFSGAADMVPAICRAGLSISFSGSLTKSNNKKAHRALPAVPQDRLLFETDSPDLMPQGVVGDVNEPANLPEIIGFAARLLKMEAGELGRVSGENARRIFGI